MQDMKERRLRSGGVYEIGLPNGKNAYGRLFKEYAPAMIWIHQERAVPR